MSTHDNERNATLKPDVAALAEQAQAESETVASRVHVQPIS
jgi:hypothetical protein